MPKIAACGVYYNCETTLENSINSILPYVDEFIAIDQGSTDKTSEILKKYATVYEKVENTGFCESHRGLAISKTSCDWILWLDGDEYWTKTLMEYLKNGFIHQTQYDQLKVRRLSFVEETLINDERSLAPRFWKRDGVTYEPTIHSQPIGLNTFEERSDLIITHNQGTIKKVLKKLEKYDEICDNLQNKNLIDEQRSKGLKGLAQFNREQLEYHFKINTKDYKTDGISN